MITRPILRTACGAVLLLSASSLFAASATPASAQGPGPNPTFGVHTFTVEGVVLQRGDLDGAALTKSDDLNGSNLGIAGRPFARVDSSQLDPGTGGGVRATVDGWFFGRPVRYSVLGAWGFEDSLTVTGLSNGPLGTDAAYELPGAEFVINNGDLIHAIQVEHESWFVTADSSLYPFAPPGGNGVRFLWGTRSIFLNDELSATVFDDLDDFLGTDNDIDRVSVEADNRMLGLQVGLEGERPVSERVTVSGFVKGGLLANFVDVDSSFFEVDTGGSVVKSYDDTEFAQFVEASGSIALKLTKRASLVASGMVLWINGIQESADSFHQVTDLQATDISADSDALFYGGRLGVKVSLGGGR